MQGLGVRAVCLERAPRTGKGMLDGLLSCGLVSRLLGGSYVKHAPKSRNSIRYQQRLMCLC